MGAARTTAGLSRIPSRLDLSTVVPSIAGPKRPQDRIQNLRRQTAFLGHPNYVEENLPTPEPNSADRRGRFPASDPAALTFADNGAVDMRPSASNKSAGRPSKPVRVRSGRSRRDSSRPRGGRGRQEITVDAPTPPARRSCSARLLARRPSKGLTASRGSRPTWHPAPGRHRLLREGRPVAVSGEARLLPRRVRMPMHRQHRRCLRPISKPSATTIWPSPRCSRATATSRAGSLPDIEDELPRVPALVIAYGIGIGAMDFDFESDPLGTVPTAL